LVKIINPTGIYNFYQSQLTAIWSIGGSINKIPAPNSTNLIAVGQDFFTNYYSDAAANIINAFQNKTNLIYVEPGILVGIANLTYIGSLFKATKVSPYGIFTNVDMSKVIDTPTGGNNRDMFNGVPLDEFNILDTSLFGLTNGVIYSTMFMSAGNGTHPGNGKINVAIDESITYIGSAAFSGFGGNGAKMEWFECKATTPPVLNLEYGTNPFNNTGTIPIYVPDASLAAYKAAAGWIDIASRIKAVSTRT
jgi:hypothetical protein